MPIIFGKDATDNILPLLLDASGNIIVSASQLTTTGGKVKVDSDGEIITSLTRDLADSSYSILGEFQNLNLPAGNSVQTVFTVPASQIWELDMVGVYYGGTVAGVVLYTQVNRSGALTTVDYTATPVNAGVKNVFPHVTIIGGDILIVNVQGATLNNDLILQYAARRLK